MSLMNSVFKNEGKLLLRNKFLAIPFLLNLLYWGYSIVAYEVQPTHYEERAAAFYQSFLWILLLNLLIVGLVAVYMASKDRESDFEALVATYQVKNSEWILGKWLITQLYGLCITVLTIVVQGLWFISATMTLENWFQHIFYVFIQMEGAFFLLISIGFLFAILIKTILAYLVIPACLVLSLLLPFDYTGKAAVWDNPILHLFTPFDYMFVESPYEGIWGIHHVFKDSILHQCAIILLGIVVISVALLLFRHHRRSQREKKLLPILITIFIIPMVVLSGIRFMQYDRALKQYISTGKQYQESFLGEDDESYYEDYKDDQPYDFAMEKTNLSVELQADDQIIVQSTLTVKNNGNESVDDVFLTLYHGLKIKECTSEMAVACSREGDFITLHFDEEIQPGEKFDVHLHYQGNVLQYRDDGYVKQAFIDKQQIYLPKEAGWYPLIGKRPLVIARERSDLYAQFELRNARLVEDFPTEFSVKITRGNQEVPLALTIPEIRKNTFQGISQYGLSLLGGNFTEEKVGNIRVVAHTEVLNGMKEVLKRYQKSWSFMEDWLGVPMAPSVIYILSDNYYYLTHRGMNHDFYMLRSENIDDSEIAYELLNEVIQDFSNNNGDFHIVYDAMVWMILNNLNEQVRFTEWYKSNYWVEDEGIALANLLQSYEEKGPEPFKDVLKYLFDDWKGLENKQDFDMEAALKQYEGAAK
ncbi:hypothetical protein J8TS2_23110 [Lederbergia ruris]|uniref:Uncharacterized protein n=1 Tax=Lederbergia ruris TaxID=217495 RepID=A0ABQ4KKX8_9BACI|nr:hypothetical protein [Lederbergia ruris]GIN57992.1 hypothetical protein J8TS2_23110 [Lederbergia ruris]